MLALLTAALCCLQDPPADWREVDLPFPWQSPVDADGRIQWLVTRVVDRDTGQPIAGATVTAAREDPCPLPGVFWGTHTARTDADGWVRMAMAPFGAEPQWFHFQAPGYGAVAHQGAVPDYPVRLRRGVDVPVEVRDAFDRPLAARIGLLLGCGHAPDVQTVASGADGRALLRGITPGAGELWPVAEGWFSDYANVPEWQPGDPPLRIRLRPAQVLPGVVLDAQGRPLADVPVGAPRCHRGPWTRTGADGTFRLAGAEAMAELQVVPPGATLEAALRWQAPPSGDRSVIRLPAAGDPTLAAQATAAVHVRVRTHPADGPAALVQVFAVRLDDGFCDLALTNDAGEADLKVPPGQYTLHAEGWLAGLGRARQALTATDVGVEAELKIGILPLAVVQAPDLPAKGRVLLITTRGEREITDLVKAGKPLPAPDEDAVFRLEAEGRDKVVSCPKGLGLMAPRPFVLPWYRPTTVTVRAVDADGKPTAVRAALAAPDADQPATDDPAEPGAGAARSECVLRTTRAGRATVFVMPEADALHPTRLRVQLPEADGQTVDLGTVALGRRGPPPLRVLGADGRPPGVLRVLLRHAGFVTEGSLAADGSWDPEYDTPAAGDRIQVTAAEGGVDLEQTLQGAGPWQLAWPDTTLTVVARTESGEPVADFTLVRALDLDDGKAGTLTLRGLPVGTHDLVLAAAGYVAQRGTVTLTPGVPVTITRTLRATPPASRPAR